ncbi:MAG: hypothetical protein AVDCRST_MAG30-2421, partial [uncultured Solirubrobacteraceae bacterium]
GLRQRRPEPRVRRRGQGVRSELGGVEPALQGPGAALRPRAQAGQGAVPGLHRAHAAMRLQGLLRGGRGPPEAQAARLHRRLQGQGGHRPAPHPARAALEDPAGPGLQDLAATRPCGRVEPAGPASRDREPLRARLGARLPDRRDGRRPGGTRLHAQRGPDGPVAARRGQAPQGREVRPGRLRGRLPVPQGGGRSEGVPREDGRRHRPRPAAPHRRPRRSRPADRVRGDRAGPGPAAAAARHLRQRADAHHVQAPEDRLHGPRRDPRRRGRLQAPPGRAARPGREPRGRRVHGRQRPRAVLPGGHQGRRHLRGVGQPHGRRGRLLGRVEADQGDGAQGGLRRIRRQELPVRRRPLHTGRRRGVRAGVRGGRRSDDGRDAPPGPADPRWPARVPEQRARPGAGQQPVAGAAVRSAGRLQRHRVLRRGDHLPRGSHEELRRPAQHRHPRRLAVAGHRRGAQHRARGPRDQRQGPHPPAGHRRPGRAGRARLRDQLRGDPVRGRRVLRPRGGRERVPQRRGDGSDRPRRDAAEHRRRHRRTGDLRRPDRPGRRRGAKRQRAGAGERQRAGSHLPRRRLDRRRRGRQHRRRRRRELRLQQRRDDHLRRGGQPDRPGRRRL